MSSIGRSPGLTPDFGSGPAPAAGAVGASTPATTVARGAGGARLTVGASLGGAAAAIAVEIPGASAGIRTDGAIVPLDAGTLGGPLATLNTLALQPEGQAGPFDAIDDVALLGRVAEQLGVLHESLMGEAPNDATTLAWRQSRGAALHLMEQAALRAHAMGEGHTSRKLTQTLLDRIAAEPWRPVRDFAYESLVGRAEGGVLDEVETAREALYPSKPPYDKWLENGQIDIVLNCDDHGSPIDDQVQFFTQRLGFTHTRNAEGSHTLRLAASGARPAVEITIPPKSGTPKLFEKMNDPNVDVVAYTGHAGYGHRVDSALWHAPGGTGENKAVVLFQCGGLGNVASLERAFPDAQVLSTIPKTSDSLDWVMWDHMISGFRGGAGWKEMHAGAVSELERTWGRHSHYAGHDWNAHYFDPTSRSVLADKFDRDGDGAADGTDHIFNVVYPKWHDAAGGYDPVVQPFPAYALDGSQLSRSIKDLGLVIDYNHPFAPAVEADLPWASAHWKAGGFFEPAPDDHRAFRFTRTDEGGVSVALSTRFSHTQQEDLSRMLAYEAGLWLGGEAGLGDVEQAALGVGMLERTVRQQGAWYSAEGALDEPWAEESLVMERYGLSGFTMGDLQRGLGRPKHYEPEHLTAVADRLRRIPGAGELASRPPTRIGQPIELPAGAEVRLPVLAPKSVQDVVRQLGVNAEIVGFTPRSAKPNQATNLVVLCRDGTDEFQVSLGIDRDNVVRTAARLDLDMPRRVDDAAGRLLDTLCADNEGLDRLEVRDRYHALRAGGQPFEEALPQTLREIRPDVPIGRDVPRFWFGELERHGLVDDAVLRRLNAGMEGAYGPPGTANAESGLFGWVEQIAGANGLDRAALEQTYLTEVAKGDGAAGRARGLRAVLEAIPHGVGRAGRSPRDLMPGATTKGFLPAAERDEIYGLLRERLGLDKPALAALALETHLGEESVQADPALFAQVRDELVARIGAGEPAQDAMLNAIARYVRESGASRSGNWTFRRLDVFAGDEAVAKAFDVSLRQFGEVHRAESAFFDWAAGRTGESSEAIRERYVDALAASGGDAGAALRRMVGSLGQVGVPPAADLAAFAQVVPLPERSRFVADLLSELGQSPAGVARSRCESLLAECVTDAGKADAALAAFDAALAGGASLGQATAAGLEAARPLAAANYDRSKSLSLALSGAHLVAGVERDAIIEAEAQLFGEAMLSQALTDAGVPGAGQLMADHVARTRAGDPDGASLVQMLADVPDGALAGSLDAPRFVELMRFVEPEARQQVLDTLLRTTGQSFPAFARALQEHANDWLYNSASGLADGDVFPGSGPALRAASQSFEQTLAAGGGLDEAIRRAYAEVPPSTNTRGMLVYSSGPLAELGLIPADEARAARYASEGGGLLSAGSGTSEVRRVLGELGHQAYEDIKAILEVPGAGPQDLMGYFLDTLESGAATTQSSVRPNFKALSGLVGALPAGEREPAVERLLSLLGTDRATVAADVLAAHAAGTTEEVMVPTMREAIARAGGDVAAALRAIDREHAAFPGGLFPIAEDLACWGLITDEAGRQLSGLA